MLNVYRLFHQMIVDVTIKVKIKQLGEIGLLTMVNPMLGDSGLYMFAICIIVLSVRILITDRMRSKWQYVLLFRLNTLNKAVKHELD